MPAAGLDYSSPWMDGRLGASLLYTFTHRSQAASQWPCAPALPIGMPQDPYGAWLPGESSAGDLAQACSSSLPARNADKMLGLWQPFCDSEAPPLEVKVHVGGAEV